MRLLDVKRRVIIADVGHCRDSVIPHLVHPLLHKLLLDLTSRPVTKFIYLVDKSGHTCTFAELLVKM